MSWFFSSTALIKISDMSVHTLCETRLCRACFDLLTEYIEVGKLITDISSKSKIYMAKHLTCFKEYVSCNFFFFECELTRCLFF